MEENSLDTKKFRWLLGINIALTILLGFILVMLLRDIECIYIKEALRNEISAQEEKKDTLVNPAGTSQIPPVITSKPDKPAADSSANTLPSKNEPKLLLKRDSITADSLKRIACLNLLYGNSSEGVTFFDIILLMLISGALGGVLCNLRGFFMHFRGEQQHFPKHLEVPYYVRVFMGAGAGLFVYFVFNFLISSITAEYLATNVPFQGMVSFLALSMLAGFGSLEFFQRLKETALTLFGQKAEKTKWEKIDEIYSLHKKGILSEAEFNELKAGLLKNAADIEFNLTRDIPAPESEESKMQQEAPKDKSQ